MIDLKKTLAAALGVLWLAAASAQGYPNRPVKLIVGYAAGASQDILARFLAQRLAQNLGQPFVVENKTGAGATLATTFVAKAPADGYTLLLAETGQLAIAPHVYKTLGYDSLKDFTPLGVFTNAPLALVTNAKTSSIKSLADLTRAAKEHPGRLNYGSIGVGSIHHMVMEVMKADLHISITHIPYRGGAFSVPALMTGEVDTIFTGLASLGPFGGQVNILAVTSAERFPLLPQVPAISEFVKGFDFSSRTGVMGPAGLPPDTAAKLTAAIQTVVHSPEFLEKLKEMNIGLKWGGPQAYTESIRQDLEKYRRAVKLAGVLPE